MIVMISHSYRLRRLPLLLSLVALSLMGLSCKNRLEPRGTASKIRVSFPKSLTLEKVLGVTWKFDRSKITVLTPESLNNLPETTRPVLNASLRYLNSIHFTKTHQVYVTYVSGRLPSTIFYYTGSWQLDPDAPGDLLVQVGAPIGGKLEFRMSIGKLHLLNNILAMEILCVHPEYSFTAFLSGRGAQDDYWSKETDVIDASWEKRNPVQAEPLSYEQLVGSYVVNNDASWKRVTYIDDLQDNLYPLLTKFRLQLASNGEALLQGLPVPLFGINSFRGRWRVEGSRLLLTYPTFPFAGNVKKYPGVFETDMIPLVGTMYGRHNATLVLEVVRRDSDGLLVRLTEAGMITTYIFLHNA